MANTCDRILATTLFPIFPQGPIGRAWLAAKASHVADGHNVEIRAMGVCNILNKSLLQKLFARKSGCRLPIVGKSKLIERGLYLLAYCA
jgi:hypothetical protein